MIVCVRVRVPACVSQKLRLGVFLKLSLLYFLGEDTSQNLEPTNSARVAGQQGQGTLPSLPFQCWNYRFRLPHLASILVIFVQIAPACTLSPLLTGLYLQPPRTFF